MVTNRKDMIGIPLGLQYQDMKRVYPEWSCEYKRDVLQCIGFMKPSDISCKYKVRIKYRSGDKPIVQVLEPKLILTLNEKRIPHYYEEGYPCLYYPYNNEWNPMKYISDTIVTWVSSWLYFYEVWLTTEEWQGGGIHPKPTNTN